MLEMKRNQEYTISIPVKVSAETLYNILWGAIHQGSQYWLYEIYDATDKPTFIQDILISDKTFYAVPLDDMDRRHPFTLADIIIGLQKYCSKYGDCIEDGNIDSCKIDSPSCDLILQYAIWGEQVYG